MYLPRAQQLAVGVVEKLTPTQNKQTKEQLQHTRRMLVLALSDDVNREIRIEC
jgi:hypothetical protein